METLESAKLAGIALLKCSPIKDYQLSSLSPHLSMDSLFANYASSDDETEEEPKLSSSLSKPSPISNLPPPKSSKPSLFSSLPPAKIPPSSSSSSSSSSLFSSLPTPKSQHPDPQTDQNQPTEPKQARSIFSSLPPPKSQPSPNPNPKRVVQFTLPLNPSLLKPNDFDDEEEEERKPAKDSSSSAASKGLSSMLPAPKNSLCLGPTATSRRSFDSGGSALNAEGFERRQESSNLGSSKAESFEAGEQERGSIGEHGVYQLEQGASGYENYGELQERSSFAEYGNYTLEQGVSGYENYGGYDGNWAAGGSVDSSYGTSYESGGGNYGSYASNWSNGAAAAMAAPAVPEMERIIGKRGRNEIPAEIVEVNQAELIKNRPREDQVKLTGIAFGPAYQPVSTSKGKPSKLHKRKHQIGTLYYDMKQKEMELTERRAKGFLTKAETQAKYGW